MRILCFMMKQRLFVFSDVLFFYSHASCHLKQRNKNRRNQVYYFYFLLLLAAAEQSQNVRLCKTVCSGSDYCFANSYIQQSHTRVYKLPSVQFAVQSVQSLLHFQFTSFQFASSVSLYFFYSQSYSLFFSHFQSVDSRSVAVQSVILFLQC